MPGLRSPASPPSCDPAGPRRLLCSDISPRDRAPLLLPGPGGEELGPERGSRAGSGGAPFLFSFREDVCPWCDGQRPGPQNLAGPLHRRPNGRRGGGQGAPAASSLGLPASWASLPPRPPPRARRPFWWRNQLDGQEAGCRPPAATVTLSPGERGPLPPPSLRDSAQQAQPAPRVACV